MGGILQQATECRNGAVKSKAVNLRNFKMNGRLADGLTKRKWPGKEIPATPAAGGKKLL
jgi:hypothetical protein